MIKIFDKLTDFGTILGLVLVLMCFAALIAIPASIVVFLLTKMFFTTLSFGASFLISWAIIVIVGIFWTMI